MVIKGDVITLNKEELDEIIDLECRKRLSLTLDEFLQRRKQGILQKSTATQEIEMLLKIAYKK
jgi:hypothetical protein